MSTTLDQISEAQANKATTVNEIAEALARAGLFGIHRSTTSALTFGYYGGEKWVHGVLTTIADGTVALTASQTNYIEATNAGVVSANTTGFTAGREPLYEAVTSTTAITSTTDRRITNQPIYGYLSKSVAGAANVTLSAAEARNAIIVLTGLLTGNIDLILPATTPWIKTFLNSTTGAFTLTVKPTGGTGIAITQGKSATLYSDGTNASYAATDPAALNLRMIENEIPTGTIDGSNRSFTLAHPPTAGSTKLYLRGVRQRLVVGSPQVGEYSLSASTITYEAVATPKIGDNHVIDYSY